jgi:hypothetical protein
MRSIMQTRKSRNEEEWSGLYCLLNTGNYVMNGYHADLKHSALLLRDVCSWWQTQTGAGPTELVRSQSAKQYLFFPSFMIGIRRAGMGRKMGRTGGGSWAIPLPHKVGKRTLSSSHEVKMCIHIISCAKQK